MEELFNNRNCDGCTLDECSEDCQNKTGRRETDNCSDHAGMLQARKESEIFRIKMRTGIVVCSFFVLIFMGWIASANYISAKNLKELEDNFETRVKEKQAEHTASVANSMKEIAAQVQELVEVSQSIKKDVDVLVETTRFERERARTERKDNRGHIEELERRQLQIELNER